jgi:DNA-binding transcriptional MerR regulator
LNNKKFSIEKIKELLKNKEITKKMLKEQLKIEQKKIKSEIKLKKKNKKETVNNTIIEENINNDDIINNTIIEENINNDIVNNTNIQENINEKPLIVEETKEDLNNKKLKLLKLALMNEKINKPVYYNINEDNNKIIFDTIKINICIELNIGEYELEEIIYWINEETKKYGIYIKFINDKVIMDSNIVFKILDCYILRLFNLNEYNDYVYDLKIE